MPTSYRHIVALGSSFASGLGIQPYANKAAKRSRLNYPSILADLLGARLTDRSAAGATTGHILHQRQRTGLRTHPPQIQHFPADADLVTVTAGGNDLGYIGSIIRLACAGRLTSPLFRPLAHYLTRVETSRPSEADVARVSESLACIVDTVREAAPRAEVVLVEYLTLAGSETQAGTLGVPLSAAQLGDVRFYADCLNRAFHDAATLSGAELVPMSALSAAHALGTDEPWVTGMPAKPTDLLRYPPFHPNAAGMKATAVAVAEHLAKH